MRNIKQLQLILCAIAILQLSSLKVVAETNQWQQEVNYEMDVTLLDESKSIGGSCNITYINNSPDSLSILWLRFPPAALNDESTVNKTPRRRPAGYFKKIPKWHYGNMTIQSIDSENNGVELIQDGSIGYVELEKPLASGDTVSLSIEFTTKFPMGRAAMRIGWVNGQYKGAYWYPMICPYTPEYGWTVNRYYGTAEAFGEYGDFLVKYRVPNGFIVAATGELINESEVLPPEKMKALSINSDSITEIPYSENKVETWVYFAENVPDVAFAMDRDFRIEKIDFGNFQSWSFVRAGREKEWHDAAEICGWTIQQLESIYGPYPWNRVVATDSWSAMEYPQLTMMSGNSPNYTYVMIHEVVHNYTPMILHSSSVDEVWIDEGFTTFIEHELTNRWFKNKWNRIRSFDRGPFRRKYLVQDEVLRGKRPYLEAVLANEDHSMLVGTDTEVDYKLMRVSSYYKTPVMLNSLRYVIGEEYFWEGFRILYRDNTLSHITELDIINAFEEASGRSLKWFFKQYIHTADDFDYAISYGNNCINIKRFGNIRLPLILDIEYQDGSRTRGIIPFLKSDPVVDNCEVLGYWDQIHEPGKEFRVEYPVGESKTITSITFNSEGLLVDRNPLNDNWPDVSVETKFDTELLPLDPYPIDAYRFTYGFSEGYNQRNGMLFGFSVDGSYMDYSQNLSMEALYPYSHTEDELQFRIGFAQPVGKMPGETDITAYFGKMNGDRWYEMGMTRKWRSWGAFYRNAEIVARAGTWERASDSNNKFVRPYIYGSVSIESSIYSKINWEQSLKVTSEFDSKNAYSLAWTGNIRKRFYKYWMGMVEGRSVFNSVEIAPEFRNYLSSSQLYDRLGHPIVGGNIGSPNRRVHWPLSHTGALLSSEPTGLLYDSFIALELNLYRPVTSGYFSWTYDAIRNFIEMTAFGLYSSAAVFHENEKYRLGVGVEAGAEYGVYNMYGADIVLRFTPFYKWESVTYGEHNSHFKTFDWDTISDHLYLYVSLKTDKFFRK